jgi:hypothetical protein
MARVLVAAQTTPGAYPSLPIGANTRDLAEQAGDIATGNYTPIVENKTMVLLRNTFAGAKTVTFTSVSDAYGRVGDITTYSIGQGESALFGPFKAAGWSHGSGADGGLWIDVSDVAVLIAVITLP